LNSYFFSQLNVPLILNAPDIGMCFLNIGV
jgi:hypothetical protein